MADLEARNEALHQQVSTLRTRHLECLTAMEDLQLDLDGLAGWRRVRERHGWATSSRLAPDGAPRDSLANSAKDRAPLSSASYSSRSSCT